MSTSNLNRREFNRKNPAVAIGAFFFNRASYLDSAAEHDVALSLESTDLRSSFENGTLGTEWEQEIKDQAKIYANSLGAFLRKALWMTMLAILCVLAACVIHGAIRPNLTFSVQAFLVVLAVSLALWGGLHGLIRRSRRIRVHACMKRFMPF
jgi:hypothetical protein